MLKFSRQLGAESRWTYVNKSALDPNRNTCAKLFQIGPRIIVFIFCVFMMFVILCLLFIPMFLILYVVVRSNMSV